MRSFFAFIKREITEHLRSGRVMILGVLFILFGIMNPAVAKLTPWMLEVMADSLAESGMTVTNVTVTAMDSWLQFFKNIPMALIAFVLLEGGILTREVESGTLVLSLTKGLKRYKAVLAKSALLVTLWTACYWICYAITYGYNAYFWDNSVAQSLAFSCICWWIFGLWIISLMTLFSVISKTGTGVLLGTGGVVLASYLIGLLPKVSKYLPTYLTDGNSLIYGLSEVEEYIPSLIITLIISIVCQIITIPIFNKKQL